MFHDAERDQPGPDEYIADQNIPDHQTGILTVTVMSVDRDAERAVRDAEIAERAFADGPGTDAEADRRLIRTQNAVRNRDLRGFRGRVQQFLPVCPDGNTVVGRVDVAAGDDHTGAAVDVQSVAVPVLPPGPDPDAGNHDLPAAVKETAQVGGIPELDILQGDIG